MSLLSRTVAITVAALALLSPNALASSWAAPAVVAPASTIGTSPASSPAVAADAAGRLTAIWAGDGASGFGVYSASRDASPAATWTAPVRLAATPSPRDLRIAVNARGQAVAGWREWVPALPTPSERLVTVTRAADGIWAAPTTFPAMEAEYNGLELQIDPAGRALGVWAYDGGAAFGSISQATGNAPVLDSAAPAAATNADQGVPFDLAIDGSGNATVLYIDATGLGLYSATRVSGSAWQTPQLVERWTPPTADDGAALAAPRLAVNASGQTAAVWLRGNAGWTGVQGSTRSAGGAWRSSTPLESIRSQRFVFTADVDLDDAGNATAAWDVLAFEPLLLTQETRYWTEVRSRTAPSTGAWNDVDIRGQRMQSTVPWPDASDDEPQDEAFAIYTAIDVAAGPGGRAAVTWLMADGITGNLQGAVRSAVGPWEAAASIATLTPDGEELGLLTTSIIDATGRGTVLWADERAIRSRSIALGAPVTPLPVDPTPTTPDPATPPPAGPKPTHPTPATLASGAGGAPSPTPTGAGTPTPQTTQAAKLVIAMYLIPNGRKCPARANATVAGVRTPLKVKAAKIRKQLRCKVTGTIVLKTATKVGVRVEVLVTAKGVKRKAIQATASR